MNAPAVCSNSTCFSSGDRTISLSIDAMIASFGWGNSLASSAAAFKLRSRSLAINEKTGANVVPGNRMADRVATRGIATDRIHVIANWCEDDKIHPVSPSKNPLRREWKLEDKFVVGYSGNLGRAHEFDTVLAAADRLKGNPEIIFLCIGGGHLMKQLAECVRERNLGNFRFLDYQDQSTLGLSLSVPDVHWISLLPRSKASSFRARSMALPPPAGR